MEGALEQPTLERTQGLEPKLERTQGLEPTLEWTQGLEPTVSSSAFTSFGLRRGRWQADLTAERPAGLCEQRMRRRGSSSIYTVFNDTIKAGFDTGTKEDI